MRFLLRKASDWWFEGEGIDKKFNPRIEEYDILFNGLPAKRESLIIDINSLEDLIEFEKIYGRIIIDDAEDSDNIKEITIYDDYIK